MKASSEGHVLGHQDRVASLVPTKRGTMDPQVVWKAHGCVTV